MMSNKKSILDVFTQITSAREASQPDLCIKLWNHLSKYSKNTNKDEENEEKEDDMEADHIPKEVTYTLGRLIQGLGSPRLYIRKCYFATLVSILSNCDHTFGPITLTYFKALVDKHLSKFESKGEKGEVLSGRMLAYGVAFRSKVFFNSSVQLQQDIIGEMLTKCKERSYLPQLVYTFLVDFLLTVDENTFKSVIWPVLINEVLVDWPSQTFDTLYCLLEIYKMYPHMFKKKLMLSVFHTNSLIHEDTIGNISAMLTNVNCESHLNHPVFETVCRSLASNENNEIVLKFWTDVANVLGHAGRIQQLAVLNIFSSLIQHLSLEKIPDFLTPSFIDYLINSCKATGSKADKLSTTAKSTLQLIVTRATEKSEESTSSSVYEILNKFLFESGHLLIDKITNLKVVYPLVAKLSDEKDVGQMAEKCECVILYNKKQKNNNILWTYKDKCYATQLLARLISHPQNQNMDSKIKHLKFMLKYAIFSPDADEEVHVTNELSLVLKNSFFTALSHQLSHMENHRMVLLSLVYYINNMISNDKNQLRNPIPVEVSNCWTETMKKIQEIDVKINKTAKRKTVTYVFQTLFLQMNLHLFVDAEVARDVLEELDRCYKKEEKQYKTTKKEKTDGNYDTDDPEPKWIEIAVELFLSLLSRDTFMLRQLISRIFPHLCPYLNAQASFQILQVLDPKSGSDILTDENDASESEEESENDGNEDDDKEMEAEDDESDSNIEDDEDMEENAIEKTRRAVRDALGMDGSVTDTESVDLDDMDEEEGKRLDMALSEAFKLTQKSQSKSKKQSVHEKALTNFRIRVLDLVDVYLDNEPPLSLVLDTIPVLFSLLEFCIKDSHQKPLETRIRSTMKKIGNLKKCRDLDQVNEELIVDVLKNLMDKGVRSSPVFLDMNDKISECCTFLLRMGAAISSTKQVKHKKDVLYVAIAAATENFFLRRDCLLPFSLFENILLRINWVKNTKLCETIASYAFNPSVRRFRQNQALTLLSCFYKNTRLLSILKETNNKTYKSLEDVILQSAINLINSLKDEDAQKFKPSFISELFSLLFTIKSNKFCMNSSKWSNLAEILKSFSNNGSFGLNFSRKYITKLCSLLKVSFESNENKSRKRKLNVEKTFSKEEEKPKKIKKNGLLENGILSENDSDENEVVEKPENVNNGDVFNDKTVIKKKKSKRKTKEHFNSKKLRNETLASNVEVFNFSTANITQVS